MKHLVNHPQIQALIDQDAACIRDTLDMLGIDVNDPKCRLVARQVAALIIMAAGVETDLVEVGKCQWRAAMAVLELTE